jgi:raffinose/stachyose/melibiose transport system substrate-binding protein
MNTPMSVIRRCAVLALVATVAITAGCSSNSNSNGGAKDGSVTLTWWHNATADPGKATWQQVADAYHAANPKVSFKVEPIQNEQFNTKVPLALQSNTPPDIYQQWGGGAEATQVKSGKLMDLTQSVSSWIGQLGNAAAGWQVDGKQYGIPYDLHVVGFWYRKDLFAQAGITTPPATMDDLNADVAKLKTAGIAPIAIGSKDKWPDAFWWAYFAVRECSTDTLKAAVKSVKMDNPCFLKAGQDLKAFLDTKPFQNAFLGTPAQLGAGSSAGLVANGKAAMELQGDWELPTMIPLTSDKAFASKLGWFPFPTISGGAGQAGAALGGGDGFSCTTKATAACADFLKYIASADVQTKLVQTNTATLPSNPAANAAVSDPSLKQVLQYLQQSPYIQTYFDQALPTSVGQALNDSIANFFAGQGTPDSIIKAVAQAAANQ